MNALINRSGFFDACLRDLAPAFYVRPLHGDPLPTPAQIKVDVKETEDCYTVHAEIPGVPKEDIQITLDGAMVSLRAEVKQEDRDMKDDKGVRSER